MLGTVVALVVIVAIVYGASLASYSPRFSVQEVRVAGANEISQDILRYYVDTRLHDGRQAFFSRANIFLYPRSSIEHAVVEFFPRIKSVKISRESLFATAITVSIEERETFARWCTLMLGTGNGEECYFLGENGFIFARATSSAKTLSSYVFRGGLPAMPAHAGQTGLSSTTAAIGQQYLPGSFAGVLALLDRLGQAGFSSSEIVAKDDQDFSVRLQQGFEIRVSYGADVGALVKNLELILASEPLRGKESELEYVDLRFGNRVYYKLKGGAETAGSGR